MTKKQKPMGKPHRIKIHWSCGVRPFCEHRTKIGAKFHLLVKKASK